MNYGPAEPKQVIIVRKDLNMRKGKIAAQAAHASMKAIFDLMWNQNHWWTENTIKCLCVKPDSPLDLWVNGIFKKIVVGAENLNEMVEAYNEAKKQGIICSLIEDAGLTEFGGKVTITAVAIGPDLPEKIDPITSKFNLL